MDVARRRVDVVAVDDGFAAFDGAREIVFVAGDGAVERTGPMRLASSAASYSKPRWRVRAVAHVEAVGFAQDQVALFHLVERGVQRNVADAKLPAELHGVEAVRCRDRRPTAGAAGGTARSFPADGSRWNALTYSRWSALGCQASVTLRRDIVEAGRCDRRAARTDSRRRRRACRPAAYCRRSCGCRSRS